MHALACKYLFDDKISDGKLFNEYSSAGYVNSLLKTLTKKCNEHAEGAVSLSVLTQGITNTQPEQGTQDSGSQLGRPNVLFFQQVDFTLRPFRCCHDGGGTPADGGTLGSFAWRLGTRFSADCCVSVYTWDSEDRLQERTSTI